MKQCSQCEEWLDDVAFSPHQGRCKPCAAAYQRAYQKGKRSDAHRHRNTSEGALPPRTRDLLAGLSDTTCLVPSETGVFWWRIGDVKGTKKLSLQDSVSVDHLIDAGLVKLDLAAMVWALA